MKKTRLALSLIVAVCSCLVPPDEALGLDRNRLVVKGRVVAYSPWENILISHPYHERLIMRVEKYVKGRLNSKYLVVEYEYFDEGDALPDQLRDGSRPWRLELTACGKAREGDPRQLSSAPQTGKQDVPSEPLPVRQFTPTAALGTDPMPDDANLPCFALKPGGFRPSK